MSGDLITAMSIERADGTDVALLSSTRKLRSADGLFGLQVREKLVTATGRHGSINRTRLRDSREIHLSILCVGSTASAAWTEYHSIARALADAVDTDRTLNWTSGGVDMHSAVRLVQSVAPAEVGPAAIRADITLRAAAPWAYADTTRTQNITAGTSISVTNGGALPTPVMFTLQGPQAGTTTISMIPAFGDARDLVLAGTVTAGAALVLDSYDRTVLLDGENARNMLVTASSYWFDLPVGSFFFELTSGTASPGTVTATWNEAY